MSTTGFPKQFDTEHVARDGVHSIVLRGELDLASAPRLEEALSEPALEGVEALALDLRALTFIDSTGVRATLAARDRCRRRGIGFSLIPGPSQVQRLFEITGLLDVLPFEDERPAGSSPS